MSKGTPAASRASITFPRGPAVSFPCGTKFFDVEGVAVAIIPEPDGGSDCCAFDTTPPRPFTRGSVSRNGAEISGETFDRLRRHWGQRICDNLNRGVLKNIETS